MQMRSKACDQRKTPAKKEKKKVMFVTSEIVSVQAALICANKNIRSSQFVWVRTDSQFRVARLNFKNDSARAPHADQMRAALLTCERPGYSKKSTGGDTGRGIYAENVQREREARRHNCAEIRGAGWHIQLTFWDQTPLSPLQTEMAGQLILKRGLEDRAAIVQSLCAPN